MAKSPTRARGGSGKGRRDEEPAAPMRISPAARFIGEQLWTFLLVGGLLAGLTGWQIAEKMSIQSPITTGLWLTFLVGVAVLAVPVVGFFAIAEQIQIVRQRRRVAEEGSAFIKAARKEVARGKVSAAGKERVEAAIAELEAAHQADDAGRESEALSSLEKTLDAEVPRARKRVARANLVSIAIWVGAVLLFRAFLAEPFKIPSGSMIPTLLVGDQIFVNKLSYGLRIPMTTDQKYWTKLRPPGRGEVAVFIFPRSLGVGARPSSQADSWACRWTGLEAFCSEDFIKRIVAVEGDTIEIRDDQLVINGKPVERVQDERVPCEYEDFEEQSGRWQHRLCDAWKETLDGHTYTTIHDRGAPPRSWPPVTVPPGHVFVMGDNRDNSNDSRYWGFVPLENLRGKAMFVWFSMGEPEGFRLDRLFQAVK